MLSYLKLLWRRYKLIRLEGSVYDLKIKAERSARRLRWAEWELKEERKLQGWE